MSIKIPQDNLDDWLNDLKPYQRNTLHQLLSSNSPEDVAKIWMTSEGCLSISHFGGTDDTKPFWGMFKKEFTKFLCDKNSYKKEKKELKKLSKISRDSIVSIVSGAIAVTIGYPAVLLVPVVTLLLFTVGEMTINAYCKSIGYSNTSS